MIRLEDRLTGTAVVRLMVLVGRLLEGRDTLFLVGQEDLGCGRKLTCNQNLDLT